MSQNGTQFDFVQAAKTVRKGTVLVVPLCTKPKPAFQVLSTVDALCDGAVSDVLATGSVRDEVAQLVHTTRPGNIRRIVVVGLGDSERLDAARIRKAARAVAKWLLAERVKNVRLWIDGLLVPDLERPVSDWCGAMIEAGFSYDETKRIDDDAVAKVRVEVASADPGHIKAKLPKIRSATTLAESVNYTRALAHRPPNLLHPGTLAAEARSLATSAKLRCKIIDYAGLKRAGMAGICAVGGGAQHKPCLIHLEYKGVSRVRTRIALIGKAVTFDTGGYSLKSAAGMESMKFDMCGGATVLGIMRAAAALRLPCQLSGIIPVAENAVSETSYRPSDIVTMASGKTVEVINTDAEGRLILADALWYAQKHCKPTMMIDFATLTGGVVTALGKTAAGLMSNDDELCAQLGESGRRTGERLWRLPLWDDYRELIKGQDSDIRNASTKRYAHPIVGGMFLKEFVKEGMPWAHLDIAGTATDDSGKAATGFGVRLLIDFLLRRQA